MLKKEFNNYIVHFYVIIDADKESEKRKGAVTKMLLKFRCCILKMSRYCPIQSCSKQIQQKVYAEWMWIQLNY